MSTYDEFGDKVDNSKEKFQGGAIICGILIAIVAVMTFFCTTKILPGYAGVVYNMDGGLESTALSQGYHVMLPWKKVIEYPVSTETVYYSKDAKEGEKGDHSINVNTKDGKQVNVDITYSYHMNPDNLSAIFEKFRGQSADLIEAGFMKNEMYQVVNEVTSQYSLMDMIGDKRPEVNAKIFDKFKADLAEYGIVIETFNLSRIAPDDQTLEAIQNVVNAQNSLTQSKVEQQQASVEAEKARIVAKGKADAALIEATGTAQANQKLQETLTELVIEQRKVDKWNGELPKYNLGSGSNTLFNIQ
jgi:regulator of protease activity HflC (stomatin/prohibitin superfamily)